jgi:phosphoribosylaminoimidazole-succinocarboxamide synthase
MNGTADDLVAEGKTKIIREVSGSPDQVFIINKDDITAGDGLYRDIIDEKGVLATETTCNVFCLLARANIPTHFIRREEGGNTFRAHKAEMVKVELVARRIATGSYLKRHPQITEGTIFPESVVTEFFLKDDSRHDPLMMWSETRQCFELYDSGKPEEDGYLGDLEDTTLWGYAGIEDFRSLLIRTFHVIEKAWSRQGVVLVDLKIELGYTVCGKLVVADVIDNDSWRIWQFGQKHRMKDKQVYRDSKRTPSELATIKGNYAWVAEATGKFKDI